MTAGPAGSLPDVLVIGGGQAGLAMGYHLTQSGRSFQIVDASAEIGQTSDKKPMRLINTRTLGDGLAFLTYEMVREA